MLITLLVHVCTCMFKIQLARTLLKVTISNPIDIITEHGLSYLLAAQQQIFTQLRENAHGFTAVLRCTDSQISP